MAVQQSAAHEGAGDCLLDALECQSELPGIERLRPPAELCALQLAQQMLQVIKSRHHLIALGDRGVTFRAPI